MNSPIFVHWWCWYDPRCCLQWASTSRGKCEAELISHVNRESTLLSNLATILHSVREGGLTRIRQEKQRAAHAWAAELSDALRHGGVGGESQAACRHSMGNDPTLGQSLKKVLHANDLWPQVWIQGSGRHGTLKHEARYIPTDQSKKGPDEGCRQSQTPSPRRSS